MFGCSWRASQGVGGGARGVWQQRLLHGTVSRYGRGRGQRVYRRVRDEEEGGGRRRPSVTAAARLRTLAFSDRAIRLPRLGVRFLLLHLLIPTQWFAFLFLVPAEGPGLHLGLCIASFGAALKVLVVSALPEP